MAKGRSRERVAQTSCASAAVKTVFSREEHALISAVTDGVDIIRVCMCVEQDSELQIVDMRNKTQVEIFCGFLFL